MSPICSFSAHLCRCAGDKIAKVFKFVVTMEIRHSKTPVLITDLKNFRPYIISDLPLMFMLVLT